MFGVISHETAATNGEALEGVRIGTRLWDAHRIARMVLYEDLIS